MKNGKVCQCVRVEKNKYFDFLPLCLAFAVFLLRAYSSNLLETATSKPPNLVEVHKIKSKSKHKSHGVWLKNLTQNKKIVILRVEEKWFWLFFWFKKRWICPFCIFWKQRKLEMFCPKFWHPLGTKFDPLGSILTSRKEVMYILFYQCLP